MKRVGVGAEKAGKKSATEVVLEKEVKSLKAEVKQLKTDNKELLKEIERLKDDQK